MPSTALSQPPRRDAERPLTGRAVVVMLARFFAVMFAADGALIYNALSTLHGEELDNPYDASQVYNQRIAASRAQDELGWTVSVTARPESEGTRVIAEFRDRDGAIVPDLIVRARFSHPFNRGLDREAILRSDGGAYEGAVPPLHEGQWNLTVEASQGGAVRFTSQNRIVLGGAGG